MVLLVYIRDLLYVPLAAERCFFRSPKFLASPKKRASVTLLPGHLLSVSGAIPLSSLLYRCIFTPKVGELQLQESNSTTVRTTAVLFDADSTHSQKRINPAQRIINPPSIYHTWYRSTILGRSISTAPTCRRARTKNGARATISPVVYSRFYFSFRAYVRTQQGYLFRAEQTYLH